MSLNLEIYKVELFKILQEFIGLETVLITAYENDTKPTSEYMLELPIGLWGMFEYDLKDYYSFNLGYSNEDRRITLTTPPKGYKIETNTLKAKELLNDYIGYLTSLNRKDLESLFGRMQIENYFKVLDKISGELKRTSSKDLLVDIVSNINKKLPLQTLTYKPYTEESKQTLTIKEDESKWEVDDDEWYEDESIRNDLQEVVDTLDNILELIALKIKNKS